jgi:hypothetical protein
LAVFFAALGAQGRQVPPKLRMESGFDPNDPSRALDPHPTDILRPYLAAGVIDTLTGLSRSVRESYTGMIEQLAADLADGDTVTLAGNIPLDRDRLMPLQVQAPLAAMQQAARNIGGFIATARLNALGGHSIQDIETWDDSDESRAQAVKAALLAHSDIGNLGDDAQLLAGATLALLDEPDLYDSVTNSLNAGLDLSFQRDPIWGAPQGDAIYIRYGKYAPPKPARRRGRSKPRPASLAEGRHPMKKPARGSTATTRGPAGNARKTTRTRNQEPSGSRTEILSGSE